MAKLDGKDCGDRRSALDDPVCLEKLVQFPKIRRLRRRL